VFIARYELNVYIQLTFGTAWGRFFSDYVGSPRANHSTLISTYTCCYQKDWRAKPGNLPAFFGLRGALDRKELSLNVPWFRRLVPCLSFWSPYFDCSSDNVRFLVDTVALDEVFVPVRPFSPVSIIPAVLNGYLPLTLVLTRTNVRILVTIQKAILFRQSGSIGWNSTATLSSKGYTPNFLFRDV